MHIAYEKKPDEKLTFRKVTFDILELDFFDNEGNRALEFSLSLLIVLNIVAMVFETMPDLTEDTILILHYFESFSVAVFTVEYIARIWTAVENPKFNHPVTGRLRYAGTPLLIIDFLAIIPFYIHMLPVDLRFIRIFRLLRILRLAKLGRYSTALKTLAAVFVRKKEELAIAFTFMIIMIVTASSLMYYTEHTAQPEVFSSIPATMWWSVVTLTTVGYGDVTPVTWIGKIIASIIALSGIGMFAIPTSILGAAFIEEFQSKRKKNFVCPHCAKPIESALPYEDNT